MDTKFYKNSKYWCRLNRLSFWPIVSYFFLVFFIVLGFIVLYIYSVSPNFLILLKSGCLENEAIILHRSIDKLFYYIFFWMLMVLMSNLFVLYVVYNLKKFFAVLKKYDEL